MAVSARWGHYSAAVGGQLYVVGGRTEDFPNEGTSSVHCFDQCRETWLSTKATTGDPPPGIFDGACTTSGHHLYVYGGGLRFHDSLHQLDMDTLEWSQLPSGPMKKVECEMISYEDELILFAGRGIPSGPAQPGALSITDDLNYKWTNELHSFNVKEGEEIPLVMYTFYPSPPT